MKTMNTLAVAETRALGSSRFQRFARMLVVAGAGACALAGCAVDVSSAPASDETNASADGSTGTTAEALKAGGGSRGFTCQDGECTCSKEIEGDCDRMLINCVGDLTDFYRCLDGWLTTDCICSTAIVAPPKTRVIVAPRTGVVLAK